jgi:hypothetical protein
MPRSQPKRNAKSKSVVISLDTDNEQEEIDFIVPKKQKRALNQDDEDYGESRETSKKKRKVDSDDERSDQEDETNNIIEFEEANLDDDTEYEDEYEEPQFGDIRRLPIDMIHEIFLFLPPVPYYFTLRILSKYFKETLTKAWEMGRITDINFAFANYNIHPIITQILAIQTNLRSLTLPLSYSFSVKELTEMLKGCSNLQSLTISNLPRPDHYFVYGIGLQTVDSLISSSVTRLTVLNLPEYYRNRRNYFSFDHVTKYFPNLKELVLCFAKTSYKNANPLESKIKVKVLETGTPKLSSVASAKFFVEKAGIAPNVFLPSHGTLFDLVIFKGGHRSNKAKVLDYLCTLENVSIYRSISPSSWMGLFQKYDKYIMTLLARTARKRDKGRLMTESSFHQLLDSSVSKRTFFKQVLSLIRHGWNFNLPENSFLILPIMNNEQAFKELLKSKKKSEYIDTIQKYIKNRYEDQILTAIFDNASCNWVVPELIKYEEKLTTSEALSLAITSPHATSGLIEFMLLKGILVNEKNAIGDTVLHSAIKSRRIDILLLLMDQYDGRKLLGEKNSRDETPLHTLCIHGYINIAKQWVEQYPDDILLDALNVDKQTAYDLAESNQDRIEYSLPLPDALKPERTKKSTRAIKIESNTRYHYQMH